MSHKLSVVTPTIPERAEFLATCTDSVANQTLGSLPHFVIVDTDGYGPAWCRNELVKDVETEWVLFLDDDDWLEYDYYETVLPHLNDENDVVYTWCKRIGIPDNLDFQFDAEGLLRANYIPVTACVKVDTFNRVGGFPSGVAYEDWALWVNILNSGGKFHLIPEKKWTYRRHPGSRTHQNQVEVSTGRTPAR